MSPALRIGIALAVLAVASCSPKPPPPPGPVPPVGERPSERPLTSAAYLARAASIDLYQVRAGELAQQRSGNATVRTYAGRMIDEHRGMAAQLSFAGRRINLLPPTTLQPEQQAWLDQLSSSPQFDADYRRQQVASHAASYRMHDAFASGGDSPTLRLVAKSAAGFELEHRREIRWP